MPRSVTRPAEPFNSVGVRIADMVSGGLRIAALFAGFAFDASTPDQHVCVRPASRLHLLLRGEAVVLLPIHPHVGGMASAAFPLRLAIIELPAV